MHYVLTYPAILEVGGGKRRVSLDQGPLVVVGACALTERHHDVFHVSGTCFGKREGGWMEGREGGEKGWRRDGGR